MHRCENLSKGGKVTVAEQENKRYFVKDLVPCHVAVLSVTTRSSLTQVIVNLNSPKRASFISMREDYVD